MSILADLSPVGALALRDYYVAWQTLDREPYRADGRHYGPGMDGDNYGIDTARGLVRRGLLEPSWIEFDNYRLAGEDDRYGDYPESLNPIRLAGDLSSVAMTQYGKRFCRAVGMAGDPTGCGPDPTSPRRLAGLMPHAVGLRNVVYVGARVGVLRAGQPIFNKVYLTPEHPEGVAAPDLPRAVPNEQHRVALFWFVANLDPSPKPGTRYFGFSGPDDDVMEARRVCCPRPAVRNALSGACSPEMRPKGIPFREAGASERSPLR